MAHTTIHRWTVHYDESDDIEGNNESVWGALHYWEHHFDHETIRQFRDEAHARGHYDFTTNHNAHFRVTYHNNEYTVTRR